MKATCYVLTILLLGRFSFAQEIKIDASAAPNLHDFLQKSGDTIRGRWKNICDFLAVRGFTPTRTINLVAKKNAGAPAMAEGRGSTIWFDVDYAQQNSNDMGMSVHEAVHLVQAFGNCPWWLTEGIADYIRYFRFKINGDESKKPNKPRDGPKGWERGYGDTAFFLNWLTQRKNRRIIPSLNQKCNDNQWNDTVWQELTKATAQQNWDQMQQQRSRTIVQASIPASTLLIGRKNCVV